MPDDTKAPTTCARTACAPWCKAKHANDHCGNCDCRACDLCKPPGPPALPPIMVYVPEASGKLVEARPTVPIKICPSNPRLACGKWCSPSTIPSTARHDCQPAAFASRAVVAARRRQQRTGSARACLVTKAPVPPSPPALVDDAKLANASGDRQAVRLGLDNDLGYETCVSYCSQTATAPNAVPHLRRVPGRSADDVRRRRRRCRHLRHRQGGGEDQLMDCKPWCGRSTATTTASGATASSAPCADLDQLYAAAASAFILKRSPPPPPPPPLIIAAAAGQRSPPPPRARPPGWKPPVPVGKGAGAANVAQTLNAAPAKPKVTKPPPAPPPLPLPIKLDTTGGLLSSLSIATALDAPGSAGAAIVALILLCGCLFCMCANKCAGGSRDGGGGPSRKAPSNNRRARTSSYSGVMADEERYDDDFDDEYYDDPDYGQNDDGPAVRVVRVGRSNGNGRGRR